MSFIKGVPSLASRRGIPTRVIYDTFVYQQKLSYWKKRGYIKPSIRVGKRGREALWSFYDLLDIKTILGLRRAGVSMQKVGEVIEYLRQNDYELHDANLITNGEDVWTTFDGEQPIEIVNTTGQLTLLNWREIQEACLQILENEGIEIE